MPSGTHRHLKRLAAPVAWGLEKSGGVFATRMRSGPHCKALAVPLNYIVSRFIGIAKNSREVAYVLNEGHISVNGRVVKDRKAPVGLFDVITIKKTNTHYRLVLNINRKFKIQKITSESANFRITKVRAKDVEETVPYIRTIDGFNFRFVDPAVGLNDTVLVDIRTNKVVDFLRFESGKIAFVFGGSNAGRAGVIKRVETLPNGKMFIYLSDARGKDFTVSSDKAIVVGEGGRMLVEINEEGGIKYEEYELSNKRYAAEEITETD